MAKRAGLCLALVAPTALVVGCRSGGLPQEAAPVLAPPQAASEVRPPRYQLRQVSPLIGSNFVFGSGNSPDVSFSVLNNKYFTAWLGADTFARFISAGGTPDPTTITVTDLGQEPVVADNETNGESFVAWSQSSQKVLGERYDSAGTLVGPSDVDLTPSETDALIPAIAYNATDDEYLLAYSVGDPGVDNMFIMGQRIDADGTLLGSAFLIGDADPSTSVTESFPRLAYDAIQNQYLVVWGNGVGVDSSVSGQRVSAAGTLLGTPIVIAKSPPIETAPDVAFNPVTNQFLIVYHQGAIGALDVSGQLVDPVGKLVGGRIRISGGPAQEQLPHVAFEQATNQFLVVWADTRDGATLADIFGQRVSGTGRLVGTEFQISSDAATQLAADPRIAADPTNSQFLVVWQQGTGVVGQLIAGTTPQVWPTSAKVTVTNLSSTSLTLNWTAATDLGPTDVYAIFQGGVEIGTVPSTAARTFNVTGLTPNTTYVFKVEARDAAGNTTTNGPSITKKTTR